MRTILIARDGSESGRAALETGLELAADEGAEAVCVHVISVVDFGMRWDAGLDEPPERVPRPEDEPVLAEAIELGAERGVNVQAELLIGYPAKQIARLANDIDADVIIVGSRALGSFKRAVLGSTSRELLSLTGRPVLIVSAAGVREPASV